MAKVRVRCGGDPRQLRDLARLSVTAPTTEALAGAVAQLRSKFDVRALRNRCRAPTPLALRDVVLVVAEPLPHTCGGKPSVHLMEIVLHTAASRDAKRAAHKQGCRRIREVCVPQVPGTFAEELVQVRAAGWLAGWLAYRCCCCCCCCCCLLAALLLLAHKQQHAVLWRAAN